jgi:phosphonate transport system substrate-binding protein
MHFSSQELTGISVLVAAFLCVSSALPAAEGGREPGLITVGSISASVKDEAADFKPLADFLSRRLERQGVKRGRVVVAQSIEEMADLIRDGEVDLYIDSPFPIARVAQLAGIQPIAVRWKKGVAEYHSVIFAREDGPLDSLEDLKGQMIAFDDPHSTSGFLLPLTTLVRRGMALKEYEELSARVAPDTVGYVFSGDDENTIFWVLKGLTAAGVMDDVSFAKLSGDRIGELKPLLRTSPVPRHLVACPRDLDAVLLAELKNILLTMHETREGRRALWKFQRTLKFEDMTQKARGSLEVVENLIGVLDRGF